MRERERGEKSQRERWQEKGRRKATSKIKRRTEMQKEGGCQEREEGEEKGMREQG